MNPFLDVDTLLFDMDGTLTDLGKRWWAPFFRAFEKMKPNYDEKRKKEVFEEIFTSVMKTSLGSSRLIKATTFWRATKALDLSLFEIFKALKLVKNDPLAFKEVVPLEGVENILEQLHSRGYKLALVTSAGDKTVNIAKNKLKVLNSFDFIVTRNTVKRIKPNPDSLLLVCKELNKKPESCAMIGDSPQDIQAGKAAGTKTVAILGVNGKYTKDILVQLKPDVLLESIHELPELFS
ncbi:MAG: HAD family hydrolase [Candidatus Heimdallarchaeota archaeon]|nr:HAD family hydrolase [Candidatus Heimdallarchaeota archaeon]MCK4954577.1 HAD family hydrolase [Candidatus Heimdallarchaeota archaeon]